MTNTIALGTKVECFGTIAFVYDYHRFAHDGNLSGMLICKDIATGQKFIADPANLTII